MGHISFVKRMVTVFVTVMMATVLAPARVQAQITDRVAVPSTAFGTITVIDTATNVVVGTPVHTFGTTDAAVTPDGHSILVVNGNTDTLTRYALDPLSGMATASVSVGLTPTGVAITPDGRKAYVTCVGEVTVVDLATIAGRAEHPGGVGAAWWCRGFTGWHSIRPRRSR